MGEGGKGVTVGSYRIYLFPSYFRPDFIRFPLVDAILQLTVELENFRLKFQISIRKTGRCTLVTVRE